MPVYSLTLQKSPMVVPVGFVTSFKISTPFMVKLLTNETVKSLAISDDKLLVSQKSSKSFLIYDLEEYRCLSTITINETEFEKEVTDAEWTPQNDIIYTVFYKGIVSVITKSGEVIVKTLYGVTRCLYISNDGIIFLADLFTGLLQSTNNDLMWGVINDSTGGWRFKQMIKVTNEKINDSCIVQHELNAGSYKVGVYRAERKYSGVIPNITKMKYTDLDVAVNR